MELDPEGDYSKISTVTLKPEAKMLLIKKGSFKADGGFARFEVVMIPGADIESVHMTLADRLRYGKAER